MVKVLTAVATAALAVSGCTTAPSASNSDTTVVSSATNSTDTSVVSTAAASASVRNTGFVSAGDNTVLESANGCVRSSTWSDSLPNCGESSVQEMAVTTPVIQEVPAVSQDPEPLYVRETLNGSALFEVDSAEISAEGFQALADLLGRIGEDAGAGSIEIVGHTDASGSEAYNQKLSAQRAQRVRDFLADNIDGLSITSSGQGELSPIADNSTEEGRAKNRRVEVLVSRSKIAE